MRTRTSNDLRVDPKLLDAAMRTGIGALGSSLSEAERAATGAVVGTTHYLTIRSLDYTLETRTSAEAGLAGGYLARFAESKRISKS